MPGSTAGEEHAVGIESSNTADVESSPEHWGSRDPPADVCVEGSCMADVESSPEHLGSNDPPVDVCVGRLRKMACELRANQQRQAEDALALAACVDALVRQLSLSGSSKNAISAWRRACSTEEARSLGPNEDLGPSEAAGMPRDVEDSGRSDAGSAPQDLDWRRVAFDPPFLPVDSDEQCEGDQKGNNAAKRTSMATLQVKHLISDSIRKSRAGASGLDLASEDGSWWGSLRRHALGIWQWKWFEYAMGLVILLNSVCIGVETQQALQGGQQSELFWLIESFFIVVYTFQLGVEGLARGKAVVRDAWFHFDAVMLAAGIASFILQPLQQEGEAAGLVSQVAVLRVCRLLRLLRVLRTIRLFRSVWRLVYGLMSSFNTMASTLFLILLVIYMFACLGVELITQDAELNNPHNYEIKAIVDDNFGDVFVAILFLFQFVTLDSVSQVYVPLIKKKPILCIYFISLMLVVSISLMNLVMAKIVEAALDTARMDKEAEKELLKKGIKRRIQMLEGLFNSLANGSGVVLLEDLETIDVGAIPEELADLVKADSMEQLFEVLDVDSSGEISMAEFVEGCLQLHLSDVPIHQIQMLHMVRTLRDKFAVLENSKGISVAGAGAAEARPGRRTLVRSSTAPRARR